MCLFHERIPVFWILTVQFIFIYLSHSHIILVHVSTRPSNLLTGVNQAYFCAVMTFTADRLCNFMSICLFFIFAKTFGEVMMIISKIIFSGSVWHQLSIRNNCHSCYTSVINDNFLSMMMTVRRRW